MKPGLFAILLFFIASDCLLGQEKSVDASPIKGVVVKGGKPGSDLRVINPFAKYQITFNSTESLTDGTPLFRTKTISGQILMNDSRPVTNARVEIRHNETGEINKGITNAQGNFKIEGVKDCLHTVSVNGQNILKIKIDTQTGSNVKSGLHQAGSAISQGASLLGGALPGGAVISAKTAAADSVKPSGNQAEQMQKK
jgi:hypothetical protein